MKVSEILPKLKANKNTYYNLDDVSIKMFKNEYNYLKKHKNKTIYTSCIKQIEKYLNTENELDYVKKYNAMIILSININHTGF